MPTNDPKAKFHGAAGDGKRYILAAKGMETYLKIVWGDPDDELKTNDDAIRFEKNLPTDKCAVFAGLHHAGVIAGTGMKLNGARYEDPYIKTDPEVVPANVWILE